MPTKTKGRAKFVRPLPPPPGTVVLGVDASSHATGLALIQQGSPPRAIDLALLTPTRSHPFHRRIDWTCEEILSRVAAHPSHVPDLIVLEWTDGAIWKARRHAASWARSVIPLAAAQAAIRQTLRRAYPLAEIETYTSTQWTQRKPKEERAARLALMVPAYRRLMAIDTGRDIADALGIAAWRLGF